MTRQGKQLGWGGSWEGGIESGEHREEREDGDGAGTRGDGAAHCEDVRVL